MTDGGAAASTDAQPGAAAPLRVAIRTDASAAIGTGHLRRCLALAEALVTQGAEVCFVVRRLDSVAEGVLRGSPHPVHWLPAPPPGSQPEAQDPEGPPHRAWAGVTWDLDAAQTAEALRAAGPQPAPHWLVVDHYALDARWHEALRAALGCRLLVVDDVADRPLAPDLLLDHNWAPDHGAKYAGRLTREPAAWLTGPRFALLSAAYRHAPRYVFHPQVRSIGVFMGGTDPGAASAHVLRCLREEVGFTGPVEVVSTSVNPQLPALSKACAASPNTTLTLDLPDLAAFFARHDLQIGAGGGATWERCCIGAPTIAIALASNQSASLATLAASGVVQLARLEAVGSADALRAQPLRDMLVSTTSAGGDCIRRALVEGSRALVDGRGAQRVALATTRDALCLRRACEADAEMLHRWRNHPAVREVSTNTAPIPWDDHVAWLAGVLRASDRWLFVAQVGRLPVGCIRFDSGEDDSLEVSLYLDPELIAGGLGRRMLELGERTMVGVCGTGTKVLATVTAGNEGSRRLFLNAGYIGGTTRFAKQLAGTANASEPAA